MSADDLVSTSGTVAFRDLQPSCIQIGELVRIRYDGRIDFLPGYDPDEAARRFWDALGRAAPGRLGSDRLSEKERRAVENLRTHQEQCDMDGVMVKVSRQAVDETLAIIDRLSRQPEAEPLACSDCEGAGVKFDREGDPDACPACNMEKIAGRTLAEWREFARRDDCLERMVPSDLRQLIGAINSPRLDRDKVLVALKPFADAAADYDEIPGVCLTHGGVEVWQQPNRCGYRLTVDDLRRAREAAEAIMRETR